VRDCFAVTRKWVFSFRGGEFGDFSFVDFFGFLDSEAWALATVVLWVKVETGVGEGVNYEL